MIKCVANNFEKFIILKGTLLLISLKILLLPSNMIFHHFCHFLKQF